ncbi:SPOR domain-containing protein [Pseudomonas sp. ABC1]|uniref:SPOR domain-containing protein n=1 Tax=Pseudomonas sp. ABC1 TaxID=2748080 RepID=UPI0015C3406D|nr:SPOR domain-containing protein [Pseudomonas sp. ABC1]QLF93864.1 SPOR domain-containing protein [Pseudomonas sp. ABC1]
MRWLFLLLLILNVFFCVQYQYRAPHAVIQAREMLPPQGGVIQLLSESQGVAEKERQVDCLFLGGLDTEASLLDLRQRLLSLDINSTLQALDSVSGEDSWVYLPPLGSRAASLQQLRDLQARNVDGYIITDGDLAGGVSLGIFLRKTEVDSLLARLQQLGFEAEVRTLPRVHRKFWLKVAPEDRRLVSPEVLAVVSASISNMQVEEMQCKVVATDGIVE